MKPILLDIMVNGRFYTQVRYTKRGFPKMINGVTIEVHNTSDVKQFVLDKYPSLNGKDFNIEFAQQNVFRQQ